MSKQNAFNDNNYKHYYGSQLCCDCPSKICSVEKCPCSCCVKCPPGPVGPQGSQGEKGDPGKTPVVGEDYFTDADKREIAEQAAELVEVPEGGTVTDEQIADAVEYYMAEHPIEVPDSSQNVALPKDETGAVDNGTEGQFAVSDGNGGINWVTISSAMGVSF